ncbi:MAG: WD40/YVTN/BNR-like repeat-containing protein, partial [Bacteroidota bacterium]
MYYCKHIFIAWVLLVTVDNSYSQSNVWRPANGPLEGNWATGFAIHPFSSDTVYAFCREDLFKSTDYGATWDIISPYGFHLGAIGISPVNPQVMWISTMGFFVPTGNNIHQSNDGGATWNLVFVGGGYPVRAIHVDPGDPNMVYVGVGVRSLYRSSNLGQSWDTLYVPIAGYAITSVAIAPSNNNIIYLGYNNKIVKSTDRGITWTPLSLGFSFDIAVRLVVDPRNANIVYAGVFTEGSLPGGMYKSTDGGMTWVEKNQGLALENREINILTINPERPDELFFGHYGDSIPLFRTTDAAESWHRFDIGLPIAGIEAILVDTLNERVYAGVRSGSETAGIYLVDMVTGIENDLDEIPERIALRQNFPNP